ncbi:hypothetical protein ACOSQ4_009721 [Xanthoceras sorbifolium]
MNVYAAINKSSGQIGIGVVVRNSFGNLVLAAGFSSLNVVDTTVAEAKAIMVGAQLAVSRGLLPLCIESDALNVVNLCKGFSSTRNDLGSNSSTVWVLAFPPWLRKLSESDTVRSFGPCAV